MYSTYLNLGEQVFKKTAAILNLFNKFGFVVNLDKIVFFCIFVANFGNFHIHYFGKFSCQFW